MGPELAITTRMLMREGSARLAAAGVAAPRRDALALWAAVSGGSAGAGVIDADEPAGEGADRFLRAVDRRAAGEPLAHITRHAGFRYLDLASDARALIPRPETEGLVELLLAVVRTGRVADIGTGTGCLALSLAREGGFSEIVATDASRSALSLARENRERSGARVHLARGDLGRPLRAGTFDALISNPPYLTADEYAALDSAVRSWEPKEALVGGRDGLEHTTRLLDEGRSLLRAGGWLAMEIDSSRAGECGGRAGALGWTDVAIHEDLFGRERFLLARRSETT